MKKTLVAIFISLSLMTGVTQAAILDKTVETRYIVEPGDTLEIIAKAFLTEERYLPEFKEGIVEMNYDSVFSAREKAGLGNIVYPGDLLIINSRKVIGHCQ